MLSETVAKRFGLHVLHVNIILDQSFTIFAVVGGVLIVAINYAKILDVKYALINLLRHIQKVCIGM